MKFSTSTVFFTLAALASSFSQSKAQSCDSCFVRLFDARGNGPSRFLTCVNNRDTINLCDYDVTASDISFVFEPCYIDELESAKFRVNGETINCEENAPYAIGTNDKDNLRPWSAPLGEMTLVTIGYSGPRCRAIESVDRERITFTLIDECTPDEGCGEDCVIDAGDGFDCDDFPFTLNGNTAATTEGYPRCETDGTYTYLRLTKDEVSFSASSAYIPVEFDPVNTDFDFSMSFGYRIYVGPISDSGDGMAFVLHADDEGVLALGGVSFPYLVHGM